MKQNISGLLAIFLASCGAAQNTPLLAPEWKITLEVVDESGRPLKDAQAEVGHYAPPPPGKEEHMARHRGVTDTNGLFVATGRAQDRLYCNAVMPGYYRTAVTHDVGLVFDKPRHEPWNPTIRLVLKEIRNPIGMYAKRVNVGMPALGERVGFDLMRGDWVAPHGKGSSSDVFFRGDLNKRAEDDYDYKLTVSFPNRGDGIQEFERHPFRIGHGSELRSPHEAPVDGYQPEWIKAQSRRPGQPSTYNIDANRNFFFRVRTILDEKGEVKSALYGKIYGDFMDFSYYLNPTPNSRNVEFDPKRNLLKVQVDEP